MDLKPSTAVSVNAVPPYGHLIISSKWRGSTLVQHFKGSVSLIYEEELGVVDIHLSNRSCILYVSESDQIAGTDYKRKIVRFRNSNSKLQGIVLVEKTRLSEQYFSGLQKFVVLELGLTLLPVSSPAEAAQLIERMGKSDGFWVHLILKALGEYALTVSITNYSLIEQSVFPSISLPLFSVALVMYWFSARLLPLSAAHCWQCFGLPAGLQSSPPFNRLTGGDQLNPGPFIVPPVLLAREKLQHKFTT
uniref:FA core complex associated protein 24 n=1 Tax=Astyanax mexicanus TaxID=7994 RepID=A0A3B1JUR3_ASTMX